MKEALIILVIAAVLFSTISFFYYCCEERKLAERKMDHKKIRSNKCMHIFSHQEVVTVAEIIESYRFVNDDKKFDKSLKDSCVVRIIEDSYLVPLPTGDIRRYKYQGNELYVAELDFKEWLTKYEQL